LSARGGGKFEEIHTILDRELEATATPA